MFTSITFSLTKIYLANNHFRPRIGQQQYFPCILVLNISHTFISHWNICSTSTDVLIRPCDYSTGFVLVQAVRYSLYLTADTDNKMSCKHYFDIFTCILSSVWQFSHSDTEGKPDTFDVFGLLVVFI